MESAIPQHLLCPRTRSRRVSDDYAPPYPAYTARAAPSVRQVVIAQFGVQSRGADQQAAAWRAIGDIIDTFGEGDGPGHHDLAHYVDARGYDNTIAIAYWIDPDSFAHWQRNPAVAAIWSAGQRAGDGLGYFREITAPRVQHYETLFNTPDRLEGVGVVMGSVSSEIREHAYWGGARDRIPLSQTAALEPSGSVAAVYEAPAIPGAVRIQGHENIAMIRSGQEWIETQGRERDLYLKEMEPVLRAGMDFLRDQGTAVGCYNNRYMRHLDRSGQALEKTFGLSFWRSLADLERWSESHPTHLAIFGNFMRIVQELEFRLALRLYHEVCVLAPDEQRYEYVNCHPGTGMMNVGGA
jgi:aldoxime dehydratase